MGLNSSQYWMQYLALRDGKSAGAGGRNEF